MKKRYYLLFILLVLLFSPLNGKAYESNSLGYNMSDGNFYSLSAYPSATSLGFKLNAGSFVSDKYGEIFVSLPSVTENQYYGANGGALSQCDMSFVKGNYYSVTYAFITNGSANYIHPYYTSWSGHEVGVCSSKNCVPNSSYSSVSSGVQTLDIGFGDGFVLGTFTEIFKSPNDGTCVSLAFSSQSKTGKAGLTYFVGFTYKDLGSKTLTSDEIQSALSSNFNNLQNSVNNSINNAKDDINNSIDNAKDSIIDGIDSSLNEQFTDCHQSRNLFDVNNLIEMARGYRTNAIKLEEGTYTLHFEDDFWTSNNSYIRIRLTSYSDDYSGSAGNTEYFYVGAGKNTFTFNISSWLNYNFYLVIDMVNSSTLSTSGQSFVSLDLVKALNIMFQKGTKFTGFEEYGKEICTNRIDATNDKLDEANKTSKGILETIKNLPQAIIDLLIDGLKYVFVPTSDQLYEIINMSKDLSENFGFVGQSVSFFIEIFTSLLGLVNADGCIELPEFTIGSTSLFESFTFWNAQNVCLADNVVLSSHIDTIRVITSIACVCMFISWASSKFFSILSKTDVSNNVS